MAAKPVEIHPSALEELKLALSWYLERNGTAAVNFAAELVLRRFPFAVFYREQQATIQVLAIAHGHRRPGYWRDRL